MSGDEFLKIASELFAPYVTGNRPANEALFRTIVGRAYYGAHHLAKEFIEQLGFQTGTHGGLPEYLQAPNEPSAKQAGKMLATLYEFRSRADYKLTDARAIRDFGSLNFVKDQVERAREVKSLLAQCSVEPGRSRIKAGIEAHRQSSGKSGSR